MKTDPKSMEFSKSSSKKEVYSNTVQPQETRKVLNRQPNSTSRACGKRTKKPPKSAKGKKSQKPEQKQMRKKRRKQ